MRGILTVYTEGSLLYSPFSKNKELFVITSGYVIAYTYDDSGKQRIHLIYGPGSYFPVITSFKNSPQRASYEALTTVVCTRHKPVDFLNEIHTNLEFSNQILLKTITQLGIFADIVINLQTTRLDDMLLSRIQNLARSHGKVVNGETTLPFKLKHHHLADMLGAERESVSRALLRLKKQRLVRVDSRGHLVLTE
jgi:CRP/FNR family transcriptional regulator